MHEKRARPKSSSKRGTIIENESEIVEAARLKREPTVKSMSSFELELVKLVHFLSFGNKLEFGLTLDETIQFLSRPIPHKRGMTAIDCLKEDSDKFMLELKGFLQE